MLHAKNVNYANYVHLYICTSTFVCMYVCGKSVVIIKKLESKYPSGMRRSACENEIAI